MTIITLLTIVIIFSTRCGNLWKILKITNRPTKNSNDAPIKGNDGI